MKTKGCPFCGTEPQLVNTFEMYVMCPKCWAKGPRRQVPGYTSKKNWELILKWKVVTLWNKRIQS